MIEYNDNNLVRQCLSGNLKAFEALVDKYQKTIFNVAYRMTNNIEDAEDITQVVFMKAYEKMCNFNPRFKFFSWIYRIAVNETLNHLNQKKRIDELNPNMISKEKIPDEVLKQTEVTERIHVALMKIPDEYQVLIVLKHFQDFSYHEISNILDISEKKVKSRLYTARQLLGNILIKNGLYTND